MYSILIVEDEYLVRQGIRSLVQFERFSVSDVREAENGLDAWKLAQEKMPDIILTDINMPKLDGVKLAALVKEAAPKTHIVFLTGYDEFAYALSAIKLGADDYLMKPFSKEDVESVLERITAEMAIQRKSEQIEELIEQVPSEHSNIRQMIDVQLSDPALSLNSLSKQLGFTPSYLSLLIKKELNISFQQYLINERMKKAKLLLLTTNMKIYEIAEAVGFMDMNYFSQRFKQIEKVTPKQYRNGGSKL